ncbi:hypothetical protein KIN20_018280 [Parelaphostrongylus tenuis]|uniref:AN1-type domain-containing protein n=1 Tax=Parelaphostrongylus tenuis TaxID=148309 RepID=A0AAD5MPL4_PARTN|nr:hypothetical protein KIN20_018280 [Parelaphostrongylus tenuis]
MAELPNLGQHCAVELCNLLDFLPVRCDACSKIFCISHFTYDAHNCSNAYKKNVQVPVCPLCNRPVPTPKTVSPDVQINEHILNNCTVRAKQKVFSNKCTMKGCKKKELVPVICPSCRNNFCLAHRHEVDHHCGQKKNSLVISKAAAATIARNQGGQNCATQARKSQISEDEALALALADSMRDVEIDSEESDRRLAEQLQQYEYEMIGNDDIVNIERRNQRTSDNITSNCSIS